MYLINADTDPTLRDLVYRNLKSVHHVHSNLIDQAVEFRVCVKGDKAAGLGLYVPDEFTVKYLAAHNITMPPNYLERKLAFNTTGVRGLKSRVAETLSYPKENHFSLIAQDNIKSLKSAMNEGFMIRAVLGENEVCTEHYLLTYVGHTLSFLRTPSNLYNFQRGVT